MKEMKNLFLCCVLLCGAAVLMAQVPEWESARRSGGSGTDYCRSIAIDSQGNQYVAGAITYSGNMNIYIARRGPSGNWLGGVQAGGPSTDAGRGIAVDGAGNAYVTGYFQGAATFGSQTLTASGKDIFVAKLSPNGNWLWAVKAGGTHDDEGHGIAVDGAGNTYVTGFFNGAATFGYFTLTRGGPFVAKLNPDGTWVWAINTEGTGAGNGTGITLDGAGNIYVTGYFTGTVIFGGQTLTASNHDMFAAKLDPFGNWLWAVKAGGSNVDEGRGIALDGAGNAYVTGHFQGAATFGSQTLSTSDADLFVAKLDPSGNWLWAVKSGGASSALGYSIAVDGAGKAYVTGFFSGIITFSSSALTSSGNCDVFVAKITTSGNWLWGVKAGGHDNDYGAGIAVDAAGKVFVTGYFEGTATFGNHTLTSIGDYDIFIAKLSYVLPKAPENVHVTMNGQNAVITWDAVTENTHGQPITPDGYRIYKSSDPLGGFTLQGSTSYNSTTYTHSMVGATQPRMFYRVRAYKN